MQSIYKSESGRHRIEEAYRSFLARWPVPAEFATVPTRQGDTFVVDSGPKDAPPVLFLHGSMGNATTWLGDIAAYAGKFRCYAVDLIGEPGLSAPSRPALGSDAYALWLDDVLEGLGIDRVSIVALSLGGLFAFDYAARRSGRITALAGIAPAGICRRRNFVLNYLPYFFLGAFGKRKLHEAVMGRMPDDPRPEVREFAALFALIAAEFRPRMENVPRLDDQAIGRLDFPILVIVGGRDVMLHSEETRDRLLAFAPDARVDYRPKARHYIPGTPASIVPFLLDANGMSG